MSAVIEARGVTAGYGKMAIIRDVTLEVRPGEIVALLGPNGAGKTTTILTLAGELPLMGGEVRWLGEPTTARLYRRARSGLGLVTSDRAVFASLTVRQNIRVTRCDETAVLDHFPELADHLDRRVALLSGGQQQMLSLARALSGRTSLILADELSMGLAPLVVDRLLDKLREAADRGAGVLLVEQHVHKTMSVADRAYVMAQGRIVLEGDTADLRDNLAEVEASYFAYTKVTT